MRLELIGKKIISILKEIFILKNSLQNVLTEILKCQIQRGEKTSFPLYSFFTA